MFTKIKQTFIIILFISMLPAQFKSDLAVETVPSNLNGELDPKPFLSIFNINRFNVSHGISMGMISGGQHTYSIAGFSNKITYSATSDLMIDANIILYSAQTNFQQLNNLKSPLSIAYDAGITYKPTENSFLQIRFQNSPHYQRYQTQSPFKMRFFQ